MFNQYIFIIFFICSGISTAQIPNINKTTIHGRVPSITSDDSVYFKNPSYIDEKYYKTQELTSPIQNGKFQINHSLSYPHMYSIQFKSKKGSVPSQGEFFLDPTTSHVEIDTLLGVGECNEIVGETQEEFKNKFVPFLYKKFNNYDCKYNNTQLYRYKNSADFDLILFSYIEENPNSYVGLWMLIERFSSSGYSIMYEKMMETFSNEIKKEELWKILQADIKGIRIVDHKIFPALKLKTDKLKVQKLHLPQAKLILIDFWFSHCRPCIEAFPVLKEMHEQYKSKGFEIVGISVDKTKYIDLWQQMIIEKELNWPQYLDENGIVAKKEKIRSFPTNFLLNEKGEVIQKNISLKELEELLKTM